MLTLHAAAASAAFQLATMPEYPSRHLAPNDVIEAFTSNLQASKHSHAFRWVSEHCRQATGVRRRQSIRSPHNGCWLVASERRLGGDDDGDGGRDSDDPSGGGVALAPTPTSPPRALATALR